MADILIVDDEKDIRDLVSGILEDEGHTTRVAASSQDALQSLSERRPELILLDVWLKGSHLDGLALLEAVLEIQPNVPIIMISGHGTVETAVEAIKKGAYDFIEKPFNVDRMVLIVERALEAVQLKRENTELKAHANPTRELVGSSPAMSKLKANIDKLAQVQSRIFLHGAPGTGKDLVARTIHQRSTRHSGPFIVANCDGLNGDNFETVLFGVEGSYGQNRRLGLLEQAHGGTLYLDEVSALSAETQSKFLRILVDQSFLRIGGTTRVHVDVRIIASASVDMASCIQSGQFREDLYHRLAVMPLVLPPLNERREDISELMAALMEQISQATGLKPCTIGGDALVMLQTHNWQGNVRELRNVVERLMIMADGTPEVPITADKLPQEIFASLPPLPIGTGAEQIMSLPLREAREIFEREYLIAQIKRFGGNVSKTSEFIGMERSALHRKLKGLGIG